MQTQTKQERKEETHTHTHTDTATETQFVSDVFTDRMWNIFQVIIPVYKTHEFRKPNRARMDNLKNVDIFSPVFLLLLCCWWLCSVHSAAETFLFCILHTLTFLCPVKFRIKCPVFRHALPVSIEMWDFSHLWYLCAFFFPDFRQQIRNERIGFGIRLLFWTDAIVSCEFVVANL